MKKSAAAGKTKMQAAEPTQQAFGLEGKYWPTLEAARADLLKSFKRDMGHLYPGHTRTCAWSIDELPPRMDKPFRDSTSHFWTGCGIWDLRGKQRVQIPGWLSCVTTEKIGA